MDKRKGTLKDVEALKQVFSMLGFEVKIRTNKTADEIRHLMKKLGGQDFTEADALVVCVLSHGDKECVFGTDGEKVSLEELMEPFKSNKAPTLAGKPKLFFIQACQGRDEQEGVMLSSPTPRVGGKIQADADLHHPRRHVMVPGDADFLIGMATVKGCVCFRDEKKGSFYIQELCRQLKSAADRKKYIIRVLTDVNHEVSNAQVKDDKGKYCIQMPEITTRLTKKLKLNLI